MRGAIRAGPAFRLAGSQQQAIALSTSVVFALWNLDPQGSLGDCISEKAADIVDLAVFCAGSIGGITYLAGFGYNCGKQGGLIEAEDDGAGGYGGVGEGLPTGSSGWERGHRGLSGNGRGGCCASSGMASRLLVGGTRVPH